jgi:hypothetical protein
MCAVIAEVSNPIEVTEIEMKRVRTEWGVLVGGDGMGAGMGLLMGVPVLAPLRPTQLATLVPACSTAQCCVAQVTADRFYSEADAPKDVLRFAMPGMVNIKLAKSFLVSRFSHRQFWYGE